ncbi:MAG: ankyrin repeat domain-containing protein [Pseudomonadota bacterium]|nr:ankyrin repeat domain-containing protein [Pseudomonadota bacterium]
MLLSTESWDLEKKPLDDFLEQFKKAITAEDEAAITWMFAPEGLINRRFDDRLSPLVYAAEFGSAKMVKLLIELGADVDAGFNPPLIVAINTNKPEIMQVLLQHGARSVYSTDKTSFLNICKTIETFKVLVDFIYEHGQESQHDMPDVIRGVCQKSSEFSEMIITKTTDDNVLNTFLNEMSSYAHDVACKMALEKVQVIQNEDLLFEVIAHGNMRALKVFCKSGRFDINRCKVCTVSVRTHGVYCSDLTASMSPLLYAVYRQKTRVQYLSSLPDIDPNIGSAETGITPLIAALKSMSNYEEDNHGTVVALLSNDKTDADLCDKEGHSALYYAIGISRSMRNFDVILARCKGEVSFNPDLMEFAVKPKTVLDHTMLMKLLKNPRMNAGLLYENHSLLNYAVLAENLDLALMLLARADVDVNHNMDCMITVLSKKDSPFLMPFILHGNIYLEFFERHMRALPMKENERFQRAYDAQALYLKAWINYESEPLDFYNRLLKSYMTCPLVLYNRVMHMIMMFEAQQTKEDQLPRYLGLITTLLHFHFVDEQFKSLAQKLGAFIFSHHWEIDNRNELAFLFLQHRPEMDVRIFNSNLFKLAGLVDNPHELRPIQELLEDQSIRASLLMGMAKANYYRLLTLTSKPSMKQKFVELYYKDDKNPLLLMWNIARLYATSHPLSIECDEHDSAQIVTMFEQFLLAQSSPKVSPLAQSLAVAIRANASSETNAPKKLEEQEQLNKQEMRL